MTAAARRRRLPAALAPLLLAALAAGAAASPQPLLVRTENGPVQGVDYKGTDVWLGIPFAAPPVGDLRLRPPQPVGSNWTAPLDASKFGPQCPQFYGLPGKGKFSGAEDCLTVNVFRPANASADEPLPVMVWIYGGGFSIGSSDEYGNYDGSHLAARGVVVVSFNYRLGSLGFLGHPALLAESGTAGNYGTQDQTAALGWVQRNVAAFGGDPDRVTIFGESAGGFSVCFHLVSPASRGLFHGAIIESGSCDSELLFFSRNDSFDFGAAYAADVGCPESLPAAQWLECVRALPVASMLNSNFTALRLGGVPSSLRGPGRFVPEFAPIFPFGPVIDGSKSGLPDVPLRMIERGDFARVPLVMGSNLNETTLFVDMLYFVLPGLHFPLRESDLAPTLAHFFNGSVVPQVEALYPAAAFKSPFYRAAAMMTDFVFACGARRVLRAWSAAGLDAFGYTFAYRGDFLQDKWLGDYHSSELPFVFDHQSLLGLFSKRDSEMADVFGTYWTNHAKSGSPNAPARPQQAWPAYTAADEAEIVLKLPPSVEHGYRDATCDFWDRVRFRQQLA